MNFLKLKGIRFINNQRVDGPSNIKINNFISCQLIYVIYDKSIWLCNRIEIYRNTNNKIISRLFLFLSASEDNDYYTVPLVINRKHIKYYSNNYETCKKLLLLD
jgi:hypothetical protein